MNVQPGSPRLGAGLEFLGAGLAFPLGLGPDGHMLLTELDQHVRQSIMMIIETARGERVMRPDFGAGLHELVFEPASAATVAMVAYEVEEALIRYEPRIDVLDVTVTVDPGEPGLLRIDLSYRVRRTDTMFNLVYPFYLERIGQ